MPPSETPWPHAPIHRLSERGTYMVTTGTYRKSHHFRDARRLDVLQRGLLKLTSERGWQLEAWAVFSNHYHFIAHSPANDADATSLSSMLGELHAKTANWINKLDNTAGRQVWHNFWETKLTHQTSYFARLNYVHQNAVHHGLAKSANLYPWCSAGWFEQTASSAQVKTVYRFRTERIKVSDDYAPVFGD